MAPRGAVASSPPLPAPGAWALAPAGTLPSPHATGRSKSHSQVAGPPTGGDTTRKTASARTHVALSSSQLLPCTSSLVLPGVCVVEATRTAPHRAETEAPRRGHRGRAVPGFGPGPGSRVLATPTAGPRREEGRSRPGESGASDLNRPPPSSPPRKGVHWGPRDQACVPAGHPDCCGVGLEASVEASPARRGVQGPARACSPGLCVPLGTWPRPRCHPPFFGESLASPPSPRPHLPTCTSAGSC